jgi:CTP synthase (UTP-ammonia lyase)
MQAIRVALIGRDFYILTQFQPERGALSGALPPVVSAFISAAAERHPRAH